MAVIMLCYLFCKICIYNFEKLLGEDLVLWLRDGSTVRKHAASLSVSIDLLQWLQNYKLFLIQSTPHSSRGLRIVQ